MLVMYLGGTGIHLYATWYAMRANGFLAALLTFVTPGLSETYWLFPIAGAAGTWWNYYTVTYLSVIIATVLSGVLVGKSDSDTPTTHASLDENENEEDEDGEDEEDDEGYAVVR